jgi:hypothetical protein
MKIIEELLEWKEAVLVKKTEINGSRDQLHWPRDTPLSAKLASTSPTSGGGSVYVARLLIKRHRTFYYYYLYYYYYYY